MNYSFDIEKKVKELLPVELRKPVMQAWLKVLLKPLRDLNIALVAFVNEKQEEAKYTGRTISLRNLLISRFGGGITIELQDTSGAPYLLAETGNAFNPLLGSNGNAFNPLLGDSGSADLDQVDFIVNVPGTLVFDIDEMSATVSRYKLAGTTFKIEII